MDKKGVEKIKSESNLNLSIDWDEVGRFRGNLGERIKVERVLGTMLRVAGIFVIAFSIVTYVANGTVLGFTWLSMKGLVDILFWLGILVFSYSMYLLRDRTSFNYSGSNLDDLRKSIEKKKVTDITISSYFSEDILIMLDDLLILPEGEILRSLALNLTSSPTTSELLFRLGLDREKLKTSLGLGGYIPTDLTSLVGNAFLLSLNLGKERVDAESMWLSLASLSLGDILLKEGVSKEKLAAVEVWLKNSASKGRYQRLWKKLSNLKPTSGMNRAYTSRYSPTLNSYGEDYTLAAAKGVFKVSIGKEEQMLELLKTLQRERGAAAIIIGEPGVGKTHFLKHLAVKMVVEDVPESLRDHRLVNFNFNKAFTDNQSLEQFKMVLANVLYEVANTKDVVLVLDDIDQLLSIRSDFQSEVVNLLVNNIDKYNLRVIATATNDAYQRVIKPIRPLAAIFQAIYLLEPKPQISIQILIDEVPVLENKYGVKVQLSALEQVVSLAPRFDYERVMPDKAIDVLEEALLEAKTEGKSFLDGEVVSNVISKKVGVKVGQLSKSEGEVLLNLEEAMHKRVVGQDSAIRAVAAALRRSRAGLSSDSKPVATFLFYGPTGVGKTEVARTLAATYFGDANLMIRVDMSEYQEEQNLDRLIGYMDKGRFVGGYLTEEVRKKPFSLVLLDEIEKANPKVLDLFLQVLDEGHLTDGGGRKIDFTNTIVIATSNAGSREIAEEIGKGKNYNEVYETTLPVLRRVFRIEFINRFDKVIMFKPLLPPEVLEITRKLLEELKSRLLAKGFVLEYSDNVVSQVASLAYDPIYGAREIKRVIQERVEDRIAERIVAGGGNSIMLEEIEA